MQVTVETQEGLKRTIKVQIPDERVRTQVDAKLRELAKTVRLNGFRPGKVPLNVVKQRFEGQVVQDVFSEQIQETFQEAVKDNELQLAGMPQIKVGDITQGYSYDAEIEVYPEINVSLPEALSITRPQVEISATDIDEMLESLRKQHANFDEVERACADGDRVTIDFEGFIDGEAFEGGKGEKMPLVLGSGSMIPGFEEQIIGMAAGEDKRIAVTFPADYRAEHLAGKATEFAIHVATVEASSLPEIDDAFATTLGISEGGVEALRADIEKNMQRERDNKINTVVKAQAFEALLHAHSFDVPSALIEAETKQIQSGDAAEAQRRVRLGLMVSEIVQKQSITPDPSQVQRELEKLASAYQEPSQVLEYYTSNPEAMQNIESAVLEQQVVDYICSQASVVDTPMTFKEMAEFNPLANTEASNE